MKEFLIKKSIKALLRKTRGKIDHSIEPDIYVISYPKSGRTWLRALIGKYLSLKYKIPEHKIFSTEFITSQSGLPRVSFSHDGSAMLNETKYQNLSHDRMQYANKKVILLGRDIKDTLVSAYFQATKRINVFEGTISEFIRNERFGILKILTFYDIWLQNRDVPKSILFIQYEDLHQNPKGTVRKVLSFIDEVNIEENLLDPSIEFCAFNNLRRLEEQNKFKTGILKPKNYADPESFKVRKGNMGGYIEYLSKEDIKFIDKVIADYGFDFSKFYKI